MENIVNPPTILSVGAISISIVSSIYLNGKINELHVIQNSSDKRLANLIKNIHNNNTKESISNIRKDIVHQKKITNQLKDSIYELYDVSYKLDKTNRKLNYMVDYLYDKYINTYSDDDY